MSPLSGRIKDAAYRLLVASFELLNRDPQWYAFLGSRGGELQDAVVALNGGTMDLSPVFRHKPSGEYVVRLTAIDHAVRSSPLEPVFFRWQATQLVLVTVSGSRPGLYELRQLVTRYGQLEDMSQHAWVLLAGADRYAEVSASFERAVAMTEDWGPDVDRDTVRSFLRAYLDHLTTSATK